MTRWARTLQEPSHLSRQAHAAMPAIAFPKNQGLQGPHKVLCS